MKKLLIAAAVLMAPLFGEMLPKHFHMDLSSQEGEWSCVKSEVRKGRYYEIWSRSDLSEGVDAENIYIVSSPTSRGENPDMRRMMRNALMPVRFMPGTKTTVHRESTNEALFEWHTPSGHHAVVRLVVEPDACHSVSHMRKSKARMTEEEIAQHAEFLDTLKLTFSK